MTIKLNDLINCKKPLSIQSILKEAFDEEHDRQRIISKIYRKSPELTETESKAISKVLKKYGITITRVNNE